MKIGMKSVVLTILIASSTLVLSGCATNRYDPNVYQGSQANMIGGYQSGTVTNVRNVQIQDSSSGVGAVAGAIIGGLAGAQFGGGTGRYVGATVGAVGGGVAGNMAESATTARTQAQEITARLSNGSEVVIVQENTQGIQVGDRIRMMSHNGHFRIVRE